MVKFPEADARLFRNKYVCRKCKSVVKAPNMAVLQGKVLCRRCSCNKLRVKRKK